MGFKPLPPPQSMLWVLIASFERKLCSKNVILSAMFVWLFQTLFTTLGSHFLPVSSFLRSVWVQWKYPSSFIHSIFNPLCRFVNLKIGNFWRNCSLAWGKSLCCAQAVVSTLGKKGLHALNTACTKCYTAKFEKSPKPCENLQYWKHWQCNYAIASMSMQGSWQLQNLENSALPCFVPTRSMEVAANFNLCQSLVFFDLISCTLCCVLNCVPSGDRRCVHLIALHMYTHTFNYILASDGCGGGV
jgi:hypothetical protein